MQIANSADAQLSFEDSPSIATVLGAPSLFVRESLAGMVTALALIPEVISFSFVLLFPLVPTAVAAPLVAIIVVTTIVIVGHMTIPNVGGEGAMAPGLPGMTAFAVPLNVETLRIIWPTAISVAFVGLLETLL